MMPVHAVATSISMAPIQLFTSFAYMAPNVIAGATQARYRKNETATVLRFGLVISATHQVPTVRWKSRTMPRPHVVGSFERVPVGECIREGVDFGPSSTF